MKVEVLYFDGCPTYKTAEQTLRQALAQEGMEAEVKLVVVNTDEEARRLRFPGKPHDTGWGKGPVPRVRARGLAAGMPALRNA